MTTWDCIYFGNYWKDDTDGDGGADKEDEKEPIKWRVLSVNGDDAFLLADQNLDCKQYNQRKSAITWEKCTLRSWLNGYGSDSNQDYEDYRTDNFINEAFSWTEQSAIKTTSVVNDDNPSEGTDGGNNTQDKIYLLSIAEASNDSYGFDTKFTAETGTRDSKNTQYAKWQGADTYSDGNGVWWLRSPGYTSYYASTVSGSYGSTFGSLIYDSKRAVRPALHLNLSSDVWRSAGKVTSDGKIIGEEPGASATPTGSPNEAYGISNPIADSDGVTTWDCIYFGNYWQNDTNGDGTADTDDEKEPIKWRILSADGDDAFLLADQNLDCRQYNETRTDVTWETCTQRSWLNGYGSDSNIEGKDYSEDNFINAAFSQSEQSAIKTTSVFNKKNPSYKTPGGNDTQDKIYLLSIVEASNASYGFDMEFDTESETRYSKNTEYAKGQGAYTDSVDSLAGNGYWWLRSPGWSSNIALLVTNEGYGTYMGQDVSRDNNAVRPALHLNLSSDLWRSAGKVTSNGEIIEEEVSPTQTPGGENPVESEKPIESGNPLTSEVPMGSPSQTESPSQPTQSAAAVMPSPSPDLVTIPSVPKVKGLAAKPGRKKLTVTWKKVSGADGYQLQFSTAKTFAGAGKKTIRSQKTTYTAKKLKEKKKYYIRIRAYQTYTDASGRTKKVYGKWTKITRRTK